MSQRNKDAIAIQMQARREKGLRQYEAMMNRARCACGALVLRHGTPSKWVHIGPCTVPDDVIPGWAYEENP